MHNWPPRSSATEKSSPTAKWALYSSNNKWVFTELLMQFMCFISALNPMEQ